MTDRKASSTITGWIRRLATREPPSEVCGRQKVQAHSKDAIVHQNRNSQETWFCVGCWLMKLSRQVKFEYQMSNTGPYPYLCCIISSPDITYESCNKFFQVMEYIYFNYIFLMLIYNLSKNIYRYNNYIYNYIYIYYYIYMIAVFPN